MTVFLDKLYDIVSNPEHSHIVCWSKNGESFKVKNKNAFKEEILSKHFRHRNLDSFIRQLNMYDFHKRRRNNDVLIFFQDMFKRDKKHLLPMIKRKTNPNYGKSLVLSKMHKLQN